MTGGGHGVTATLTEPATIALPIDDDTVFIDATDLPLIAGHHWRILQTRAPWRRYAYARIDGRTVYMHRLIANTPPGYETDHENRNGLDNRRANLRTATRSQNRANIAKPVRADGGKASSRYKGVSWDCTRDLWLAKIHVNGTARNLGRYRDEDEAARAYNEAAVAAWGEFARLNDLEETSS